MRGPGPDAQKTSANMEAGQLARLEAPGFVTFTNVTPDGADDPEFVISNEATGKFFLANRQTVQFFVAIKETGSVQIALAKSAIPARQGEALVKRLVQAGLLVRSGETQSEADPKNAPLESKLISLRWDMVDASRTTDAVGWLGRLLYGPLGYLAWIGAMVAMVQALLGNPDKLSLGLRQIFDVSWTQLFIFAAIYVGLKAVHEMGHALAYRTMCLQEGLDPGPIRMGISIFAFTPFPFTDVTGAWRIRSTFRRVMIGAGGIYFETWVIALMTLFWAQTNSGMLQTTILQVAVFAGALALLFNLNPAIKLDGYYMLTDYLRRPNLSGRASQAARSVFAKAMGAQLPDINWSDFTYWVLSYAYRWTIFGGIFWLIYQFDARLAAPAAALVIVTLIIRPLFNTLKFAFKTGITPLRSGLVLGSFAALVLLLTLPFPDRLLIPGQMRLYDTKFLEVPETGQLQEASDGRLALHNPEITQQIADLDLRRRMLDNLLRASLGSGAEISRLEAEISGFEQTQAKLKARLDRMELRPESALVWTPLGVDTLRSAWVTPGDQKVLAAQSRATDPYLRLRLDQALLERDLPLRKGAPLTVRAVHDPSCEFPAILTGGPSSLIATDRQLILRATLDLGTQSCADEIRNGSAVVARLETKPRSVLQRLQFEGDRLLQDRLPIDLK